MESVRPSAAAHAAGVLTVVAVRKDAMEVAEIPAEMGAGVWVAVCHCCYGFSQLVGKL